MAGPTQGQSPHPTLNPSALALADAARILSAAGGQPISTEMLGNDILVGAPTNADGTLNLVHFAAWLVKQMAHGD